MFLVRSGGRKPMFRDRTDAWQTTIYLKVGYTYQYRFEIIDKNGQRRKTPKSSVDVF